MKLADDALIGIIEILRVALVEAKDVSQLLRSLDLEEREGKLTLSPLNDAWLRPSSQG